MVLSIDPERERISLGIKQMAKDPFSAYIAENPKGSIVKGSVREVDAKGAIIDLGNGIEGQLRASELARDRVEDARTVLKVGEEVEAKFTGVDRKTRAIALSIKAKDIHEEQEAMQSYRTDAPTGHQPRRPAEGADRPSATGLSDGRGGRPALPRPAATVTDDKTPDRLHDEVRTDRDHHHQAEAPAGEGRRARGQADPRDHERRARDRANASRSAASAASRCTSARRARAAIPKTGEAVALSGKHVPHFKPGKDLRERVNDGQHFPIRE